VWRRIIEGRIMQRRIMQRRITERRITEQRRPLDELGRGESRDAAASIRELSHCC